jgi:taurine--2-oxoglutarate transaminase
MGQRIAECKKRGLLPCANFNRLHVVPPCIVTDTEAKDGLAILDEVFTEIDSHYVGA